MPKRSTQQFSHKFSDGTVMTVTVDLSDSLPKFTSSINLKDKPKAMKDEFVVWRDQFLVPRLAKLLTPEQAKAAADFGRNLYKKN